MKSNYEIARIFKEIAFLLEIKGENIFKIRAYNNASLIIKNLPFSLYQTENIDKIREIKGIGEAISKKIIEIIETEDCKLHRELLKEFPREILEFGEIKGIGAKTAKKLFFDYNIKNIDELKEKINSSDLKKIISAKIVENIKNFKNE